MGLRRAAFDAKHEKDARPENLLSAFGRVCHDYDFFRRATNPALVNMELPDEARGFLDVLRKETAKIVETIGKTLGCVNGFLEREAADADEPKCRARLDAAAGLIKSLSKKFEPARKELLMRWPSVPPEIHPKSEATPASGSVDSFPVAGDL